MDDQIILYHVSFEQEPDLKKLFVPGIPKYAKSEMNFGNYKENDCIPRVCFSDSIEDAVIAIGKDAFDLDAGEMFTVFEFRIQTNHPSLIHPEYLYDKGYVRDAKANHEFWFTEPILLYGQKYKIISVEGKYDISWDALDSFQVKEAFVDACHENLYRIKTDVYNMIMDADITFAVDAYDCYKKLCGVLWNECDTCMDIESIIDDVENCLTNFPWALRFYFEEFEVNRVSA